VLMSSPGRGTAMPVCVVNGGIAPLPLQAAPVGGCRALDRGTWGAAPSRATLAQCHKWIDRHRAHRGGGIKREADCLYAAPHVCPNHAGFAIKMAVDGALDRLPLSRR